MTIHILQHTLRREGPIDWAALVKHPRQRTRLHTLCHRMLGDDPLQVRDATDFVLRELARDNWARCQDFQGKAKPDTWLYLLTVQLVREYTHILQCPAPKPVTRPAAEPR